MSGWSRGFASIINIGRLKLGDQMARVISGHQVDMVPMKQTVENAVVDESIWMLMLGRIYVNINTVNIT